MRESLLLPPSFSSALRFMLPSRSGRCFVVVVVSRPWLPSASSMVRNKPWSVPTVSGILPSRAGISPAAAGGGMSEAIALDLVQGRVRRELWRERADGSPFKAAYAAVARRLGITARRVRAYHHGEVAADDVRAAELIAADEAWRTEIIALRARLQSIEGLAHEAISGVPGALAQGRVGEARETLRGEVGGVAREVAPVARVVRR